MFELANPLLAAPIAGELPFNLAFAPNTGRNWTQTAADGEIIVTVPYGNSSRQITPQPEGVRAQHSWIVANPEGGGVDRPSSAGAPDPDPAVQSGVHLL